MKMKNVNSIREVFFYYLKSNENSMSWMYIKLFEICHQESLEEKLNYLKNLSEGKDDFFKEEGKESWFAIFHKSIRQTDFFENVYIERTLKLLTDEETKKIRFLRHKFHTKELNKESEIEGELYTHQYREYLELLKKSNREKNTESVSGNLDALLWELISSDMKEVLYTTLLNTFHFCRKGI